MKLETPAGSPRDSGPAGPARYLRTTDALALIVGIVIGAGIFRTPSLVAANTGDSTMFLAAWILGGLISLNGAFCYAELTTAFPHAGGDYHFLSRAFGKRLAFLFAWARMSVIQTGSIALLAFIFGDFFSQVIDLGPFSSVIYAAAAVILLTTINILGLKTGTLTQKMLTAAEVLGVLLVAAAGLFFAPEISAGDEGGSGLLSPSSGTSSSFGLAMVFVLLTFGGWNEAAYVSAELRRGKKTMVKVLIGGILIITAIYLLVNMAYIHSLGINGVASSEAVAGEVMRRAFGEAGVVIIGILVAVSALTSANASIFTGARTNYALGKDFQAFKILGVWDRKASGPVNAFLVQGLVSLALVGLGFITRKGFETIVEYTAPVFWFFFLMTGLSVFVLRKKEPDVKRPFRVPLYPIVPLIFCITSAWLLYSSLAYTGLGALVGVGVLVCGILLNFWVPGRRIIPAE
ncbi:amino acid/polyamine/organocation transporter (APC superfamily) [Anseongella ginsenosidimutans]|uniref:Amino acid/polyamine/organocation transporter (APC superfamily) n=1 Tax=Anseongella ginsenosidimutans TaxID=496056 RepID=A0A4R3KU12_9SPHI|nr:amino acid permease [Anseongella ginsenosidimutans]QEC53393.1 amino acid permease [Anseongella ginsenosidimutans]TCS88283.1 amino acid/polyamine/organocation transporter (APC superfamily) [Anseongella ginsenosidimutans]